jgi:peptidylprolyl isomerase
VSDAPPTRNPKRQRKKEGAQARRAAELAALRKQQRNRRLVRIGALAVVAIAAVLLLSWLGGDDDEEPVATESTSTTAAEDATTTTAAPIPATPLTCEGPSGENTDTTTKPTVPLPEAPATELTCQDLVVGTGDEVLNSNDVVSMHYVGVGQATGEEFDASWERGEPYVTNLQDVIAGWTEGIPGMKVGGRRVLTIPGSLAYGPEGNPSAGPVGIQPDETLVFVVDLVAVNPEA